jgi:iron complex outermembrane recepter protein
MKVLFTPFFLLTSIISFGQMPQDTVTINEVVVSTKTGFTNLQTARAVQVLQANTFKATGTTLLHNMLNTSAGVYMVDMGNEQHAMSIRLPMNYDPLYSYLENGIPIRPAGIFNNNALLEINKFAIDKIEVIKGPFSSGYGATSIGAAINFLQQSYKTTKNEIGVTTNGYGQIDAFATVSFSQGKWKTFINIGNSQRRVDKSLHFDYTKQSFSLKTQKNINTNNQLFFQNSIINYIGDQRDGYDSANFYKANYTSFDKFSDRKTLAIRNSFGWINTSKKGNKLQATIFNRIVDEKQNPFYLISYDYSKPNDPNAWGQITSDKFISFGLNVDHTNTFKNKAFSFAKSLFIDYTPNNTYTSNFIKVDRQNYTNLGFVKTDSLVTNYKANLLNIAASATLTYKPTNNIIVLAGLRYDVLQYDFSNYLQPSATSGSATTTNKFVAINPEVSILYKLTNSQSIFAQFSNGFTPPTLSKMYRNGANTPQLNPANYTNFEVGYKLIKANYSLLVNLYSMQGNNEFVTVFLPTGGIDVINAGQTLHQGIEVAASYKKHNFECQLNASYAKHSFVKYVNWGVVLDGKQMNSAPNYMHNFQAIYHVQNASKINLIAEWQKIGPYFITANNSTKYDGYDIFNIKATCTFKNIICNIGINNIANTIYATNADGTYGVRYYPGLPRTIQAGFLVSF